MQPRRQDRDLRDQPEQGAAKERSEHQSITARNKDGQRASSGGQAPKFREVRKEMFEAGVAVEAEAEGGVGVKVLMEG